MPSDADAAEAFGILADPTRIEILRTFAEALDQAELDSAGPMMPTLSFSEVYDRIDVDSTSRLSYHIEKLDGTFLRHTNQGWRFTITGTTVVRFILSGSYAGSVAFNPIEIEGCCPHCDAASLRAVVEDHVLFRLRTPNGRVDCDASTGSQPRLGIAAGECENAYGESLPAVSRRRLSRVWRYRRD